MSGPGSPESCESPRTQEVRFENALDLDRDRCSDARRALEGLVGQHERALLEITRLREELSAARAEGHASLWPVVTKLPLHRLSSSEQGSTLKPEVASKLPMHRFSYSEQGSTGKLEDCLRSRIGRASYVSSGRKSTKSATSFRSAALTSSTGDDDWRVTWNSTVREVVSRAGTTMVHREESTEEIPKINSGVHKCAGRYVWSLESFMAFVIVTNTLLMGISSELFTDWFGWVLLDAAFAGVFTLEILLKLAMLGWREYVSGLDWRWNHMEVLLVLIGWVELGSAIAQAGATHGNSSIVSMVRLLRLAKLVRLIRLPVFYELLMMVNGAIGSFKTLLYSMILISMPLFSVALVLKETLGNHRSQEGHGAEMFKNLHRSFFTLFRCFVAGDCSYRDGRPLFVLLTEVYGWGYGLIYCVMQFMMVVGLFNVIIAITVENTVTAAKFNDINVKRQRLRDRERFVQKAQALLQMIWHRYLELPPDKLGELHLESVHRTRADDFDLDVAGNLQLTQKFFEDLCNQRSFTDILRDLDISEDDQFDLFKTLDADGRGSINLMEFIIGIGKLRGEARKADIVSLSLSLLSLHQRFMQLELKLNKQQTKPHSSIKSSLEEAWAKPNSMKSSLEEPWFSV